MKLALDKIRTDGGTQPRAALRIDTIQEYAELMRAGVDFPPVTVYFDGESYWLSDGFHRLQAARQGKPDKVIEAEVIQGTLADAQWHSFSANKSHGLRRTNEDIERVVKAALAHPKAEGLSNYEIAAHCGVDEKTVRKYRNAMRPSTEVPQIRTVTRCGTTYRQNVRNIGKNSKSTRKGPRISSQAMQPVLAHSLPNPMVSLSLPRHNPVLAAATIFQLFDPSFVRILIAELTQRLKGVEP